MEPSEAIKKFAQHPEVYPLTEITSDDIGYVAFGDYAFKKDTLTSLQVYGKTDEFYSLESLIVFIKFKNENHGVYVKEAAAANVKAVTRIDRRSVTEFLASDGSTSPSLPTLHQEQMSISLKTLIRDGAAAAPTTAEGAPEAKRIKLDPSGASEDVAAEKPPGETSGEGGVASGEGGARKDDQQQKQAAEKKKEVEIRALNDSLTKDRIAEMRRKRQKNLEKGIVNIDESLATLTSASLPKTRIHRTRENVMLGCRDLSNVLEVIAAAQRQWDLNEKKEKVAAVHATTIARGGVVDPAQQRSGYSRYAQEAFAHEKTKEIQTEGSFIGSNLSTLKQGSAAATQQKAPEMAPPRQPLASSAHHKPSTATTPNFKRRSPIIIVPSAMNTMMNLYNARDVLQNLGYVPVEQRRKETTKRPTDLAIQRQKNGVTYNIRVIDNAEKLAADDWDRVIAVFVMGVAWQFKGWKWNGNPTDIFTHIPAFHFHVDTDKPCAQVMQWSVHKIPVSATKRHMDKARFSQMWETIENFVRKNKPHLCSRLGLQ